MRIKKSNFREGPRLLVRAAPTVPLLLAAGFHGDYQVEINGQVQYFSILQGVNGVQNVTITL